MGQSVSPHALATEQSQAQNFLSALLLHVEGDGHAFVPHTPESPHPVRWHVPPACRTHLPVGHVPSVPPVAQSVSVQSSRQTQSSATLLHPHVLPVAHLVAHASLRVQSVQMHLPTELAWHLAFGQSATHAPSTVQSHHLAP